MRLTIALALVGALGLAAPAYGCPTLPARSAAEVPIIGGGDVDDGPSRTVLRVCVGGRAVQIARARGHQRRGRFSGSRIGAASSAGHRVAWIEERHRGGTRAAIVTVARVGRAVRVLRRFVVQRQRTAQSAELDVLLTQQGDLAWLSGTYGGRTGVVAVKQPGRPTRRLASYPAARLAIEDGRTLRWDETDESFAFFDLRSRPCPSRSRFRPLASNDRVILTRGVYGEDVDGTTVIRGCDPSTGRDRVLLQNYTDFSVTTGVRLVGLDRTWAVFVQSSVDRYGAGPTVLTVADAVTGHRRAATIAGGADGPYPSPNAQTGFIVTDAGALAWLADGVLYALASNNRVVVLDQSAVLAGLHAEGDAVAWTHDGAARRAVP